MGEKRGHQSGITYFFREGRNGFGFREGVGLVEKEDQIFVQKRNRIPREWPPKKALKKKRGGAMHLEGKKRLRILKREGEVRGAWRKALKEPREFVRTYTERKQKRRSY